MNYTPDILTEALVDNLIEKYPNEGDIIQTLNDESKSIAGSNKYLQWMVKQWMNTEDSSEEALEEIINATSSFHQALPRINRETITKLININDFPTVSIYTSIVNSPKDINSYPNAEVLRDISMRILLEPSRSEKEKFAKTGADKIYEDDRWLLAKINTKEASCYYGAGSKWCTAATKHNAFGQYNKNGNLYYLIDKSRKTGPYYKMAIYKSYAGKTDSIMDETNRRLSVEQIELLSNILPPSIFPLIDEDMGISKPAGPEYYTLSEFSHLLDVYAENLTPPRKIRTESGMWEIKVEEGIWYIVSEDNNIKIQATPFHEGQEYGITVDIVGVKEPSSTVSVQDAMEWSKDIFSPPLPPYEEFKKVYMEKKEDIQTVRRNLSWVVSLYANIMRTHVFNDEILKKLIGGDFALWSPIRRATTMVFKYPPKEGSLTQRFLDFIKNNPGKTKKEFYDSIGKKYRPGHNSTYFAAIKDAGIVTLTRKGRQFVYTIGPNHQAWTEGKLRLI